VAWSSKKHKCVALPPPRWNTCRPVKRQKQLCG
jgi:hypothetical protein